MATRRKRGTGRRGPAPNVARDNQVADLYRRWKNCAEVARLMGLTRQRVVQILDRVGITHRDNPIHARTLRSKILDKWEEIRDKYTAGTPFIALCDEYAVSHLVMGSLFREHGFVGIGVPKELIRPPRKLKRDEWLMLVDGKRILKEGLLHGVQQQEEDTKEEVNE